VGRILFGQLRYKFFAFEQKEIHHVVSHRPVEYRTR
jgi:hypothetical protein